MTAILITETELPHVLWLLHHSRGSIRYYPDDSTLQHYVITRPQKLYDIPSTLLTHTFAFKKGDLHRATKDKLWTRGVFTMETLRELWGGDQVLTPELIILFLLHLNIIAQYLRHRVWKNAVLYAKRSCLCTRRLFDCS